MQIDEEAESLLKEIVNSYKNILNDNLTGIYLHGSLALGDFSFNDSDIDILVVVKEAPSYGESRKIIDETIRSGESGPKNGIEMSIVLEEHCKNILYPFPFELHFSNMHIKSYSENKENYIRTMNGLDPDIVSYIAVINQSGITLCGKDKKDVFADVSPELYMKSVFYDIYDAKAESAKNPVYYILNLCRTIAYRTDGIIRSKTDGGIWAAANIDSQFRELVSEALECRRSGKVYKYEAAKLASFINYALEKI